MGIGPVNLCGNHLAGSSQQFLNLTGVKMTTVDPRLLRCLATAKAAELEVSGFEVSPRSIKIQIGKPSDLKMPDKYETWRDQKLKGSVKG